MTPDNPRPEHAATASGEGSDFGPAVGTKFWPNGDVRFFPGNTIISMIDPASNEAHRLHNAIELIQDALGTEYTLLPPDSWHMTVFELLCDQVRDNPRWSRHLSTAMPLESTDRFFIEAASEIEAPTVLRMQYRCIKLWDGLSVSLDVADPDTSHALHAYRERLSEVTGVRFPDYDTYQFHITLGYEIRKASHDRQREISKALALAETAIGTDDFMLPAPELRFFNDMTAFYQHQRPIPPTEL